MNVFALALVLSVPGIAADNDDELFKQYGARYALVDGKYYKAPSLPEKPGEIAPPNWKVGDAGKLKYPKVFQVLSPKSMLVSTEYIDYQISANRSQQAFLMVHGSSTEGLVNGKDLNSLNLAIIGTTTYKTRGGASNTVFLAVAFDGIGLDKEQFSAFLKEPGIRSELETRLPSDIAAAAAKKRAAEKQLEADALAAERQAKAAAEATEKREQAAAKKQAEKKESLAEANLQYALKLIGRGELDKAKKRLAEIVNEFPGTNAASQAEKKLKEMTDKP